MSTEDLAAGAAMGFLLGLFAFAIGLVRVRRWKGYGRPLLPTSTPGGDDRQGPRPGDPPAPLKIGTGVRLVLELDMIWDLAALCFILAMLLYGAWAAPRLRYVVAAAAITVVACALVRRAVLNLLARR